MWILIIKALINLLDDGNIVINRNIVINYEREEYRKSYVYQYHFDIRFLYSCDD